MRLSEFFHSVWDLVRRPFEDCTSCCDVLDPDYYHKTSPGVHRSPQMFDCWGHDLRYNLTCSRSLSPLSTSHVKLTQHSTSSDSQSHATLASNYSSPYYEENETDRPVQFLFYGGSDHPTGGLYSSGYRSDLISNYVLPMALASIKSPRINHEMPCFFSPRDTPQSPMSAPIYSPHVFTITEKRPRRASGYYNMACCR